MAEINERIAGTARESVEDSAYTSGRTGGIAKPAVNPKPNIDAAERYVSGKVDGVTLYRGKR